MSTVRKRRLRAWDRTTDLCVSGVQTISTAQNLIQLPIKMLSLATLLRLWMSISRYKEFRGFIFNECIQIMFVCRGFPKIVTVN